MKPDYAGLIARLEAASGPSTDLDFDIRAALAWDSDRPPESIKRGQRYLYTNNETASIDAALALAKTVLPGWKRSLFEKRGGGWISRVSSPRYDTFTSGEDDRRPTAPIAILIALLRALQSQEPRDA